MRFSTFALSLLALVACNGGEDTGVVPNGAPEANAGLAVLQD